MKSKFKGFTLVELILVMAIMSILMLAIMNMFKPVREIYVDSTQYEAQRTAQNGVIQYITESVKFSTDMGIYNDSVSSASTAVDNFSKAFCINNNITDASGTAIAPYNATELNSIKDEIKKYVDIMIIDNSTAHNYSGKNYTGRIIRRKIPATPSASIPTDPALTSAANDNWRIALGEAYYGGNTFSISIGKNDANSDGTSDDGMLNVAVTSTSNAKRDITKKGKETDIDPNSSAVSVAHLSTTNGGVLCRNLVSGSAGVTKQGIYDVKDYNGTSTTSGAKTYIVFLSKDARDKVDAVIKAAAATP